MRPLLPALAVALLLATPLAAQQPSGPHPGTPEVQAPVPEVGAGRGAQPAGQVPESTERGDQPTGTPAHPAAAQPQAPQPAAAAPAPAPFSDRGQLSAEELELQATLRGERITGRISIPDTRAASLIQPAGRDWRAFHNRTLAWVGGIAVLGMLALLTLFYLVRGRVRLSGPPSGRTLLRFNLLERANHWMVAGCFITLGLSGLNLTFGRHLLLPLIGPDAFSAVTQWGKYAHNFLAFPFTLGLVLMLLLWVKDNIPNRGDITWIREGGGIVGKKHPPAGRFNAGQKMVFWVTVLGGGAVAASGYFLIFPFFLTDIAGMQLSHIIHSLLAVLMIAAILAHIYIGTLGMEGAFAAMGNGQVDLNWAKEHHSLWVEQEMAKGRGAPAPDGAKPV